MNFRGMVYPFRGVNRLSERRVTSSSICKCRKIVKQEYSTVWNIFNPDEAEQSHQMHYSDDRDTLQPFGMGQ